MNALNIPTFAIPGLMPVTSPNAEQQRRVGDNGSLDLVVWCQEMTEPLKQLTFKILDEENKIQFQDLTGQFVFIEPAPDGRKQYRIVLPQRQVGLGSYVLAVSANGVALRTFDIVRENNGFSNWAARNSFYQLPAELSGSALDIAPDNLPENATS